MAHCVRSVVSFTTPSTPQDFRHHVLVRDADPRLFDAVLRHLGQRLYGGPADNVAAEGAVRIATLRQGLPLWLAAVVTGGGALTLLTRAPAWIAAAVIALGIALAALPRKYVWLVAHPSVERQAIDLWMAGTATGDPIAFADEFASLIEAAETLHATLGQAGVAQGSGAPDTTPVPGAQDRAQQA